MNYAVSLGKIVYRDAVGAWKHPHICITKTILIYYAGISDQFIYMIKIQNKHIYL